MFGLGIWEIVVVVAVALIVLGPRRLPGMARQLGRALREFRRATNELRYSIDEVTDERRDRPVQPPAVPYTESTEVVTSKPAAAVGPKRDEPAAEPVAEDTDAAKPAPKASDE